MRSVGGDGKHLPSSNEVVGPVHPDAQRALEHVQQLFDRVDVARHKSATLQVHLGDHVFG